MEKEGWRRTCADASHHKGNPQSWFDQQDEFIAALDFAIGVLASPAKPAAPPPKPMPSSPPKQAVAAPAPAPAPVMQGSFL
jgi:hypothetical protein